MRALVATAYGPPDRLTLADLPRPEPGPGQIQVRIAAATVNPTDIRVIAGEYAEFVDIAFPYVLGNDFAGTVTQLGPEVANYQVGDEVFGQALPRQMAFATDPVRPSLSTGALAEYAVFESDTPLIAKRPPSVSAVQAAALAIGGWTALGIIKMAELRAGEKVFVVGGLGGVGTALIPLLAARKAHVIATARTAEDIRQLRELGVAETIGYELSKYPRGVDLVFNLALPVAELATLGRVLRPGGRLVSIIWPEPSAEEIGRNDVQLRYFFDTAGKQVTMAEVAAAAADGTLKATIGRHYRLDEAPLAAVAYHQGGVRGNIVVEP